MELKAAKGAGEEEQRDARGRKAAELGLTKAPLMFTLCAEIRRGGFIQDKLGFIHLNPNAEDNNVGCLKPHRRILNHYIF